MGTITEFKNKTLQHFHEINHMGVADIENFVSAYVQDKILEAGFDATLVDVAISGSRCRGLEKEGSDLDVVVEISGNEREDDLFNLFHEEELLFEGIAVDINPITANDTGTLEEYLPRVEKYLQGKN